MHSVQYVFQPKYPYHIYNLIWYEYKNNLVKSVDKCSQFSYLQFTTLLKAVDPSLAWWATPVCPKTTPQCKRCCVWCSGPIPPLEAATALTSSSPWRLPEALFLMRLWTFSPFWSCIHSHDVLTKESDAGEICARSSRREQMKRTVWNKRL